MEHAELAAPRVTHDPVVKAALLLVVSTGGAERFQALDLSLNINGAGAALLGGPCSLLESAHDHSAASAHDDPTSSGPPEVTRIGQHSEC